MLVDPGRTQYDLNFRLVGTHVRVHPLFWLMGVVLGWRIVNDPDLGLPYLALYLACVFLSILLHEFGHIWAGKAFGSDGNIVLYSFGGLAIGSNDLRERWQRIVVSLSGPAIQLALYGALWVGWKAAVARGLVLNLPFPVIVAIDFLLQINLLWPLLNLLPVWPLDGGQVMREICTSQSRNGESIALKISIGVAAFLAAHAFLATPEHRIPYLPTSYFAGLLFAILAMQSYQLLSMTRTVRYEEPDDRLPWER